MTEFPQKPFTCQSVVTQGFHPVTTASFSAHQGLDEVPLDAQGRAWPAPVRATLSGVVNGNNTYDPGPGKFHQVVVDTVIDSPHFIDYLKKNKAVPVNYTGNVILKHAYLHGLDNLVKAGDSVIAGQDIMICGNTGDVKSGGIPVPDALKGKPPYPGLHLHRQYYLLSETGKNLNLNDATNPQGTINPSIIDNYQPPMTIGYQKTGDQTVYVAVGPVLVPLADWNAFLTIGGSESSVVRLDPTEFAKFTIASGALFQSINH